MGVRTRGLDISINAKRQVAGAAARAEAKAVIERWNEQLAAGRDMLWSPTIRAALIAGTPWLDVFCPGCGTGRAIDLRKVDRHPLASVATLVLGLRCSWCPELAPMPRILGLHALPPVAKVASNLGARINAIPPLPRDHEEGRHDLPHHGAHGTGGANIAVGAAVYMRLDAVHTPPTAHSNPRGHHRPDDCHCPKVTDIARAPWSDRA
jgi:hypothetical protein